MKRIILGFMIISVLFCGCGKEEPRLTGENEREEREYAAEGSGNLARLEIHSGEDDELLKVIDQKELLDRYDQYLVYDGQDLEEDQKKLKNKVEEMEEMFSIVSYKYPAALINDGTLEKNTTVTVYENSNILKIEVSGESIKNMYVSSDLLTFYCEAPEEDMEFYRSLMEE